MWSGLIPLLQNSRRLARLNRAKHLLKTTELPFKQIAQKVGYQSVASFTNTFASRVGVTPSRFRQYPI